jgi:hypothetical protein
MMTPEAEPDPTDAELVSVEILPRFFVKLPRRLVRRHRLPLTALVGSKGQPDMQRAFISVEARRALEDHWQEKQAARTE